jgi:nucleotide-binding universal stress UspA family protein
MKIVATVDFSTTSEAILKITKIYAQKLEAEVFLLHAEPPHDNAGEEDYDTRPEVVRLKKDARALERVGVKVTPVFLQGQVCETILAKATQLQADLIITGAHGHGGTNCKIPMGHISECILFKAKIPVLVIHG